MPNDVARRFAAPLYLTGALFFLTPVVDVVTNVWPPNPASEAWRYGAVGVGANYLISMIFGALLASVTAAALGQRRTVRTLGACSIASGVVLVLLAAGFALDVLQLRNVVPPADMAGFKIGAAKAGLKYLTSAAAFLLVGWVGWKAGKRMGERREDAVLVRS